MKIKYCGKCHREAYRTREKEESIEVFQGGRTLLKINQSSEVSMNISCPVGHPVKLKIAGQK